MTLLWTAGIIYGVVAIFFAVVNYASWAINRGIFEADAKAAARRAVRAHLWPLMLVDMLKKMREDAK